MSDDDTYEIPLQDQRVFGAGIKRKRVKFVPSTTTSSVVTPSSKAYGTTVGDFYRKLVLPGDATATTSVSGIATDPAAITESILPDPVDIVGPPICEICKLPLEDESSFALPGPQVASDPSQTSSQPQLPKTRPHEASIAHQVCLEHSHPPSHLDRNRKGLAYLSSYGWDPDARLGLGASGQGVQFPIKTKRKDDTLGLGLVLPEDVAKMKKERPTKLDAGKVRKLQNNDKRKAERLREMFYRNDDVERYLGGG